MPGLVTPAIPAGSLAARPQPTLTAGGGVLLRPWRTGDARAVLEAYQDEAIQRWHVILFGHAAPAVRQAARGLAARSRACRAAVRCGLGDVPEAGTMNRMIAVCRFAAGAVTGFAVAARKSSAGAEILRIAIDAAWRGRGHGTRLLSHRALH